MRVSRLAQVITAVYVVNASLTTTLVQAQDLAFREDISDQEPDDADLNSCGNVYSLPSDQQCAYVRSHCDGEENQIGRINYLSMYYCSSFRSIALIPLILLLLVSFISLGITASEYLCPNLYTISKFLNLSDNLAGLTLLALGNSSPDVLSTYKAMSVGSSDLALSELIGASLFITTVVIGTMAVVHPFTVPRKAFLRDAGFFLGVTCLLFFSLFDSYLSFANCITMLLAYFLYVLVVLYGHSRSKAKLKRRLRDQRARANFLLEGEADDSFSPQDDEIYLDTFSNLPSIEALNFGRAEEDTEGGDDNNDEDPAIPGSYGLKMLLRELSKHTHIHNHIKLSSDRPQTNLNSSISVSSDPRDGQSSPPVMKPSDSSAEDNEHSQPQLLTDNEITAPFVPRSLTFGDRLKSVLKNDNDILIKLLAPQLFELEEEDIYTKIQTILLLPISIPLRISNPVRDQATLLVLKYKEQESMHSAFEFAPTLEGTNSEFEDVDLDFDFEADRILLIIQTIVGLDFLLYVFPIANSHFWIFWLPVCTAFAYFLSYVLKKNYHDIILSNVPPVGSTSTLIAAINKVKIINYIAAFAGFVISISWVSLFATEIISILKSVAIIFNLSDDILGITVFAVGNSVGDFISNYTIARMGMPVMAFGACFGGPLLALCSMGFSGLLLMDNNSNGLGFRIENTNTIKITSIALILNILMLLFLVPANGWKLDKRIGSILILNWIIATTISLLVEIFTYSLT